MPTAVAPAASATVSSVRPAVAGVRVKQRLKGPQREAAIVHRGALAVYADLDGWCLGVLGGAAAAAPCALSLAGRGLGELGTVSRIIVGEGRLVMVLRDSDRVGVEVRRLREVSVPRLAHRPSSYAAEAMLSYAGPAVAELGPFDPMPPTETLLGRGSGLTPLGDDVCAGWAAMSFALGLPPGRAQARPDDPRPHTTLLSATLLDCARRGEVLPQFRDLLVAIGGGDEAAIDRTAAGLARVGHTSGAGLLLGAARRLEATHQVRRELR